MPILMNDSRFRKHNIDEAKYFVTALFEQNGAAE